METVLIAVDMKQSSCRHPGAAGVNSAKPCGRGYGARSEFGGGRRSFAMAGGTTFGAGCGMAVVFGVADAGGSQPGAWRHVPAMQDAGKPTDITGYY